MVELYNSILRVYSGYIERSLLLGVGRNTASTTACSAWQYPQCGTPIYLRVQQYSTVLNPKILQV